MSTNGDISVLKISGTSYNLKDATVREAIENDPNAVMTVEIDSTAAYDYLISFEEPPSTEETWVFDDVLDYSTEQWYDFSVIFSDADGTSYSRLLRVVWIDGSEIQDNSVQYSNDSGSTINPYSGYTDFGPHTGWSDENYKTITLAQPATGDLLTFLQANATKQ